MNNIPYDDPDEGNFIKVNYKRPYLYPRQELIMFHSRIINGIKVNTRFVCCEASTKSGKTHGCIVWILEKAILGKDFQNCWWVAPVYKQAKIAFRRIKYALRDAINEGYAESNDTELWVKIKGGATIWFLTGEKPDNLYGEDVIACVIDEASRVREESWFAVYSVLTATEGECRLIGNVTNRSNFFYILSRKAEAGGEDMQDWAYDMITAYDAIAGGVLKKKIIEKAERDLPEDVFKALYLCIPPDDGGNPFGEAYINKCIAPLSNKEPVCWGWDLAKSGDWTYGVALDEDGTVCRLETFRHDWTITKNIIPKRTEGNPTLIDSTGVGDGIVEDLNNEDPAIEGFKFSVVSKQQLLESLAYAVQHQFVKFPEGAIPQQMRTMEYKHTRLNVIYTVPEGMHDDAIMALALAWKQFGRESWSWSIDFSNVIDVEYKEVG